MQILEDEHDRPLRRDRLDEAPNREEQRVPIGRVAGLVDVDDEPTSLWLDDAARLYVTIADQVPSVHRPAVPGRGGQGPIEHRHWHSVP